MSAGTLLERPLCPGVAREGDSLWNQSLRLLRGPHWVEVGSCHLLLSLPSPTLVLAEDSKCGEGTVLPALVVIPFLMSSERWNLITGQGRLLHSISRDRSLVAPTTLGANASSLSQDSPHQPLLESGSLFTFHWDPNSIPKATLSCGPTAWARPVAPSLASKRRKAGGWGCAPAYRASGRCLRSARA